MHTTNVARIGLYAMALATVLALIAAMLLSAPSEADAAATGSVVTGVEVEAEVNASLADAGSKGFATVTFLVTNSRTQKPLTKIANTIPFDAGGITLPNRVLINNLSVAPFGCGVTPVSFRNEGRGVYSIMIVPSLSSPTCDWKDGDYLYVITVKGPGGAILGEGLAKLSVS